MASKETAANRQIELGDYNIGSVAEQADAALANLDLADQQNAALLDKQKKDYARKSSSDRSEARRKLIQAAQASTGAMGSHMNGSNMENFLSMIDSRNDADNVNFWDQLQENWNTAENAYNESLNQNALQRNEIVANARKQMRDIEANTSANLQNIDEDEYSAPGEGRTDFWFRGYGNDADQKMSPGNMAQVSGYIMPDNAQQVSRKVVPSQQTTGTDYFSKMLNGYRQRR